MATQTAQKPAQTRERVLVTLEDGRSVEALTRERMNEILNGMAKKGKVLTAADEGEYFEGIKVIGNGNAFEGPIGLRYIYNVDLLSHVAYAGKSPKKLEALAELKAAEESGDLLAIHNACRKVMNVLTVSFNAPSQAFSNNQLIKAQVEVVTTDNGSLITLRNVSAMPAKKIGVRGETIKFDITDLVTPTSDEDALS